MKATLTCVDGHAGGAVGALIAEATGTVTHVVMHLDEEGMVRRLMPLNMVAEADAHTMKTAQTLEQLRKLDMLDEVQIVPAVEAMEPGLGEMPITPIAIEKDPPGTYSLDKNTPVHASDHKIGSLDALIVEPSGVITHIVLREGHLWAKKDVTIPAASVAKISRDAITLTLSKHDVDKLPTTPA